MNKALVGFVAGAVVVGAAGYGTLVYPSQKARAEVDKAIAQLPPEAKARYDAVEYSLFTRTLVVTGAELAVQDGDETVTARIGRLSLRGVAQDKVAGLSGTGITLEGGDRATLLQAESLSGEQIEVAEGVLTGLTGAPAAINVKRLALTGISVAAADNGKVQVREVVLGDYVQADHLPRSLSLGIHGLQVPPAALPDAEAREGLAKLGYGTLSLNFDMAYALSPETNRLSIRNVAIGGDDVGRLSVAAELGGVQAQALADPLMAMAAVQSATLESLEMRYDDSSLAGRVLKLAASEAQMPEAEFKTALLARLAEDGAQATPLAKQMLDSAAAFLTEPKSLSLRMKPAQPLPLFQLMMAGGTDPYAVAQATGLTVTANK